MQKQCFPLDIEFLTKDNLASENVPELVKNLNLFIDSRCILRSRISKNVTLSYDAINPIVLAQKHPLSHLIIRDSHFACKHLGDESTLNHLRQTGFWVVKARQAVKKVLKKLHFVSQI